MTEFDGNAIAGLLHVVFGREMTTALATCAHCGNKSSLAQVQVYRAAGTVLRCRACAGQLMVIVERGEVACVDTDGFAAIEPSR